MSRHQFVQKVATFRPRPKVGSPVVTDQRRRPLSAAHKRKIALAMQARHRAAQASEVKVTEAAHDRMAAARAAKAAKAAQTPKANYSAQNAIDANKAKAKEAARLEIITELADGLSWASQRILIKRFLKD